MNASDVLHYAHRDVQAVFTGLTPEHSSRVGVTTRWSLKDLAAHLASYEVLLAEALGSVAGDPTPTPTLDEMKSDAKGFNDSQVAARRHHTLEQILREHTDAHERAKGLASRLGAAKLAEPGTIPWYGPAYSLDDLIVYTIYGHAREHCAQARSFRKQIGA